MADVWDDVESLLCCGMRREEEGCGELGPAVDDEVGGRWLSMAYIPPVSASFAKENNNDGEINN